VPTVHGGVDHGAPRRVRDALQLRPQQGRDLRAQMTGVITIEDATARNIGTMRTC